MTQPAQPAPTQPSRPKPPPASIVIPTRGRPAYLEVALASIVPQARAAGAEVVVVDDAGDSPAGRERARRLGARYEPHPVPRGLNAARNTGVARTEGELVVFVDDDVQARPGWLGALLQAAREHPEAEVFAGRIRARLEGRAPRGCGREAPPVTTLDLGERDLQTRWAWGANMAIRRGTLMRVGPFDESLAEGGDEQEWQERLRGRWPISDRSGARTLYVAGAAVDHRRAGPDARLRALARTAQARGRAARRFDERRGEAPSLGRELATLAGCGWHVVRYGCPAGLTMVAHSAGRVREALRPYSARRRAALAPAGVTVANGAGEDFLSGASGTVGGLDAVRRAVRDGTIDAWEIASGRRLRLDRAARRQPPRRRVLVLGVVRPPHAALAARAQAELRRSRHEVDLHTCPPGSEGRFQNLNRLLAAHPAQGHDWLVTIDDDVVLARGFLDRLLFLCERFDLQLAQPAHRLRSHAAWQVTRRQAGSLVRETELVEIGPVTAFAWVTFGELLPFPPLRMGWGLDAHWAALARARGWRRGVVDAVTIAHRAAPAAAGYSRERAVAEAREFLADRPYVRAGELERTLTTHSRW